MPVTTKVLNDDRVGDIEEAVSKWRQADTKQRDFEANNDMSTEDEASRLNAKQERARLIEKHAKIYRDIEQLMKRTDLNRDQTGKLAAASKELTRRPKPAKS